MNVRALFMDDPTTVGAGKGMQAMMQVFIHTNAPSVNTSLQMLLHRVSMAHNWEVLQMLARASCSVHHLAEHLELSDSEISRSLHLLDDLGFVESHSMRNYRFYTLDGGLQLSRRTDGTLQLLIPWETDTSIVIELDVTDHCGSTI